MHLITPTQTIDGTVANVNEGVLRLVNVVCNNSYVASMTVSASDIKELDVLPEVGAAVETIKPAAAKPAAESAAKPAAKPKADKARKQRAPRDRSLESTPVEDVKKSFDFERNLALFDKKKVFDEIRQNDTVDQSQRLVTHNRASKNYANDEMILGQNGANSKAKKVNVDELLSPFGPVPLASPLQLVQLEQRLLEEGRSADGLVELAARGVSEVAIKALGVSRFHRNNHNSMPLVVVVAGPNRSGLRALAAGRLLATRRVQVFLFTVGTPPNSWKDHMRAFKASGATVVSSTSELEKAIEDNPAPAELILDGLQGFEVSLADLYDKTDLASAQWVVSWANRQKAPILAVDVPSGDKTQMNARWIACCGFPVHAIANTSAKKFVVDLGVAPAALNAAGMRRFESVWFGAQTVMPVDNP